jgi:hypothetical protein
VDGPTVQSYGVYYLPLPHLFLCLCNALRQSFLIFIAVLMTHISDDSSSKNIEYCLVPYTEIG